MGSLDWGIVAVSLLIVLGFAVYTKRFVKGVADFVSGGRCAGRYLLANARGEAASGVANTMSKFEIIMISGFTLAFWEKLSVPVLLVVGITGFVTYRYRQTRAMTLAQFLEMRYSRAFRLFMGALAFLSGILNYGIFPAISSRFFVYFLGLPTAVAIGGLTVPTYVLIMAAYLSCALAMLLIGGQVTLMVTDCVEGILSHLVYILVIVAVFLTVSWSQIVQVMNATPPNQSMIDPFDAWEVADFNIWFIVMGLVMNIYGTMAMQNSHGFNSAARTPHEGRMAGVLGGWRSYARAVMLVLVTTAAVTFIRHPDFASQATPALNSIHSIADPQIQKQMTIPVALSYLLPVGIKGLFCAIMVLGLLAGDCGHMHSWGTIFVQDVIMPLRRNKQPLTPRQHLWLLRASVIFVAVFAFFFSIGFRQTHYVVLWMQVTGGIFIAGAGAVIIGGLYWKRGTTAAAWGAVICGATLSLSGIFANQFWQQLRHASGGSLFGLTLPEKFWLNGVEVAFFSAIAASLIYATVSLLQNRSFNLDQMLNRGKYSDEPPTAAKSVPVTQSWFGRLLGFDSDFTRSDRWIAGSIFVWSLVLVAVNIVVSVWNIFGFHWSKEWWAHYWFWTGIAIPCAIAFGTLFWFGIGGFIDMRHFFDALRSLKRDVADDGTVRARPPVDPDSPAVDFPTGVTDPKPPGPRDSVTATVA